MGENRKALEAANLLPRLDKLPSWEKMMEKDRQLERKENKVFATILVVVLALIFLSLFQGIN